MYIKLQFFQTILPAKLLGGVAMQALLNCCCGLDIHKDIIQSCILKGNADEEPKIIRAEFKTMRKDLQSLCDWLLENECFYIAMESTGVYWRPLYQAIEEFLPYFQCILVVNCYHMRNFPGR